MFYRGLTTLLLSTLVGYVHADLCYRPDGSEIGGLRTCDPSAPASACCAPGDECTSSGLCKAGNDADNNWMWRGPCSDQSWESEYCPQYCYNSTTSENAASVNAFKVMACSEDTYCCTYPNGDYPVVGFGYDCCDDPARAFTAGPATHVAGATVATKIFVGFTTVSGNAKPSPTTESTSTSSKSSVQVQEQSVSSPATSSTVSSTASSVSSSTNSSTSQTTTSTDPPSTAAAIPTAGSDASFATGSSLPASSTPSGGSGLSTGESVGIGVGATVGALALLAIGVFAGLKLRKREVAGRSMETESQAADRSHEPWGKQPAYSRVSSEEHKPSEVGINEAGWQLPSEVDSTPCGELEGKPVDKAH